jgi:hypothetical protein
MYINLSVLTKSKLQFSDLVFLAAISQKESQFLIDNLTNDCFKRLEALSLLTNIKRQKKDEHAYTSLRVSDAGKKLLADLSYEGASDDETQIIAEWLIKVYKMKNGGIVKNKQEILRRIQWFKTITQIKGNYLGVLMQCFINDTYADSNGESVKDFMQRNKRGVLSNMCDNICWQPTSLYDKHKTLDKSPLFTYYEDNKEYVQSVWQEKLDEFGNRK